MLQGGNEEGRAEARGKMEKGALRVDNGWTRTKRRLLVFMALLFSGLRKEVRLPVVDAGDEKGGEVLGQLRLKVEELWVVGGSDETMKENIRANASMALILEGV